MNVAWPQQGPFQTLTLVLLLLLVLLLVLLMVLVLLLVLLLLLLSLLVLLLLWFFPFFCFSRFIESLFVFPVFVFFCSKKQKVHYILRFLTCVQS